MNKHRCVSTAVPDNALRVSPQRTPTREKNRPAHCQQRTALVETPTEHKTTETVPSLPLGRILLLATLALIVRQPPDQTLWPPHASGPWKLKWPNSGQIRTAHCSNPTQLATPPPREPRPQPFSHVPRALATHPHTGCPLAPTPEHHMNTTRGTARTPPPMPPHTGGTKRPN